MTLSKIEVDGNAMLVSNFELNINMHALDGLPISLKISDDNPPLTAFAPKLTDQQIEGLWLITEGSVIPGHDAHPGWRLAEKLKMPRSNISSRVTAPLEKMGLICYDYRPTTKKNSLHPKKEEKAWCLKRASMETVFKVLFWIFLQYNFNNLSWNGEEQSKRADKNVIANMRCLTLAYLQKRINEYKSSERYYLDLGVKPPIERSLIAERETTSQDHARITFRAMSPLRYVDETRGDQFPSSKADGQK